MKGGSRSVLRRMVVAFFVFHYIEHSPITPSSGTQRRYQNFLGHPFSTPGICGLDCLKRVPPSFVGFDELNQISGLTFQ